ncbi:unnamed protein product [Alopecurus aequalis]
MASSSSCSSSLLAMAVLAALFAGAWCAPTVTFTVEKGSDKKNLVMLVTYEGVPGDIMSELEIREHCSDEWVAMTKREDGFWTFASEEPLRGPFNFRYFTEKGMKDVFDNVVPKKYTIGATYAPAEDQ